MVSVGNKLVKIKNTIMKKILQYCCLAGVMALSLASCKKAIDLEPTHNVDGNDFFTRIEDHEMALTGTYARLLQDSYYGNGNNGSGPFVGLPDMMSDNLFESSESEAKSAIKINPMNKPHNAAIK